MSHNYTKIFPYKEIRKEQKEAIDFGLKTLIDSDKKFCIVEAGTGVGKSAIGLTLGKYLDNYFCHIQIGRDKKNEDYYSSSCWLNFLSQMNT